MSTPKTRLYLTDIVKEKNIKEPNDILSALIQHDIIFASLLNANRLVEIDDSGRGIQVSRKEPVKIREEYLQEILHKGNWTGTLMEANMTVDNDNPYFKEETVHTMSVRADDSLSLSIEDLFVYADALADLEAQYPDIFKENDDESVISARTEDSLYALIGILLDMLVDKNDNNIVPIPKGSKYLFQKQSNLIEYIEKYDIYGLKKSSLEDKFSKANSTLKSKTKY